MNPFSIFPQGIAIFSQYGTFLAEKKMYLYKINLEEGEPSEA